MPNSKTRKNIVTKFPYVYVFVQMEIRLKCFFFNVSKINVENKIKM